MRVAFISESAPNDVRAFSGIPYFMSEAIRAQVERMEYVYTPMFDWDLMLADPLAGRTVLQDIGRSASATLKNLSVDVVICQGSSMIPYLDTSNPIVLWHDSTWHSLLQIDFKEFEYCHPLLRDWDQSVFDKCALIAFAADWVREVTILNYGVASDKLAVVPFGANVRPPSRDVIFQAIDDRRETQCQLTFLGVDWMRKGLPVAYSLLKALNRHGIDAVLTVIGGAPGLLPAQMPSKLGRGPLISADLFSARLRGDRKVEIVGNLDKQDPADLGALHDILSRTHFLVHPAEFECFGVALAEASAFGVPVLGTNRQGLRTIVRESMNGRLFLADRFVADATSAVVSYFQAYDTYGDLARRSLREYETRLNWSVSVGYLLELIGQLQQATS